MTDRELEELKHDVRKAVAVHVGDSDTWFPEVYALIQSHVTAKAVPGYATDNEIEALIEPILKAGESSLKHYSLYKPREEMRQAMRAALAPLQAQIATARDEVELWKAYAAGNSKPLDFADSKRITTPAPENGNGPVP